MPLPIIAEGFAKGLSAIPYAYTVLKFAPWLLLIYALKMYFGGKSNRSERVMHSKVVMITGGTSGVGAIVARELAQRGAQIVLLTQHELTDFFLVEFIMQMRADTNNELITAEQVDLASLHSIRKFATKWIDNAPPRRLDMIVLCGNTMTPASGKATTTEDGLESNWGINYIANFHLLSILSPALRVQPPDRDVRIIFGSCSSYMGGSLAHVPVPETPKEGAKASKKSKTAAVARPISKGPAFSPSIAYATSKFALITFANAFQKHLDAYQRPDKAPMNARVINVDPGWTRTPGMRRYLTVGSLWGLLAYVVMWPFWWLVLKSPDQGAQSFLFAAMEAEIRQGEGGKLVKECRLVPIMRSEVTDENLQQALWQETEKTIEALETEGAIRRAGKKEERQPMGTVTEELDAEKAAEETQRDVRRPGSRKSKKAAASTVK
ncbi:oxidoreductase-like protein [Tothia fuscella]|uniref:Oxidoreductase-like protein n=1 Tax=Tothia fuscella TaxID=1048955 RepID=A0A9P4NTF8_9PEZI|nr:oxidoreductase-like protein [Tothia fuscella]